MGIYINVVFVFSGMIDKIIEIFNLYMFIVFDIGELIYRYKLYDDYKVGRKEMFEELGS